MIRKFCLTLVATALLPIGALAQIAIDFVSVGDIGNASDPATGSVYGSVSYGYQISTYEITNTQYAAFLNAVAISSDASGLYNANMGSSTHGGILASESGGSYSYSVKAGFESKPVNFVSIYDAARFVNWLTSGSTETGSYNLGATTDAARFARTAAAPGTAVQYFITNENEWYKAAYYDPTLNDGDGGYWEFPTQSNTAPSRLAPYGSPNRANYGSYAKTVLDVGTYTGSASYYGTFDQEGNISEFMETLSGATNRIRRGSHFDNYLTGRSNIAYDTRATEASTQGFRIVAIQVIPEPSTVFLLAGGAGAALAIAVRRKGRRGFLNS